MGCLEQPGVVWYGCNDRPIDDKLSNLLAIHLCVLCSQTFK